MVVTEDTLCAAEAAREAGRSLWRVSSTVFAHIASDQMLQPLGHFAQLPEASKYPPTPAGEQVRQIAVRCTGVTCSRCISTCPHLQGNR